MLYYNNIKCYIILGVHKVSNHLSASSVSNHVHDVQYFTAKDITKRLDAAKEQCRLRGVRFTPLRQQIYQLVLQANQPVGAYDLITQLQQARLAQNIDSDNNSTDSANMQSVKNVAPPTVYRSLEFLLDEGLIHQLTSINAYVPCCHPRAEHTAAFLICDDCRRVQECSSLPVQEMMSFAEQDVGFTVSHSVIELSGRCQACQ